MGGGPGPALRDGWPRGDADTQSSVTAGQVPLAPVGNLPAGMQVSGGGDFKLTKQWRVTRGLPGER